MNGGHLPPGFVAEGGELVIAGRRASDWAAHAGDTPLFVYDGARVAARIAAVRAALPDVSLHYAVKANPHRDLLAAVAALVDGLDVASEGELQMALAAGADPRHVSFAGPGKRDRELAAAIRAGITLNIESEGEFDRLARIGAELGVRPRAAIRVNPPFELKGAGMKMAGGARPFGVDAARVQSLLARFPQAGVAFEGFQIFAGSQNLSADAIVAAQSETLALAARLAEHAPGPVRSINIGGGFGLPYFGNDVPLDLAAVGAGLSALMSRCPPSIAGAEIIVELGRYLVGEAGVYLTRVVDVKSSAGQTFVVVDGGLHHQLAASGNFGTVIRRNYPIANASRFEAARTETVHVVGCLCTPLDRLGDGVDLPPTQPGDLIALFLAGAYGRTASPERFLGHPPPLELFAPARD